MKISRKARRRWMLFWWILSLTASIVLIWWAILEERLVAVPKAPVFVEMTQELVEVKG